MATPRGKAMDWRQVRVGAVIIVALLLLLYAIFQVGKVMNVFADRYTLYTLVESASGLQEGSPVHLAGQRVGQIDEIRFLPPTQRPGGANLLMALSVDEKVAQQIRRDSRATILSLGLLGDRYVNIEPGTPRTSVLMPGDTLASAGSAGIDELLAQGGTALDSVMLLVNDLRVVTAGIAQGRGTLGQLVQDQQLYDQMVGATVELQRMLGGINRSEGTLNRLIHDPVLYQRLNSAVLGLDSLTRGVAAGRGSIGRLLASDTLYDRLLVSVEGADAAAVNIRRLTEMMAEGDGTFSRIFNDPALYDQLLKVVVDLQTLVNQIRENPKPFVPDVTVRVF